MAELHCGKHGNQGSGRKSCPVCDYERHQNNVTRKQKFATLDLGKKLEVIYDLLLNREI